jgi:hypothetical protein
VSQVERRVSERMSASWLACTLTRTTRYSSTRSRPERLDGARVTGYAPTRSHLEPVEGSLAPDCKNVEKQEVRVGW